MAKTLAHTGRAAIVHGHSEPGDMEMAVLDARSAARVACRLVDGLLSEIHGARKLRIGLTTITPEWCQDVSFACDMAMFAAEEVARLHEVDGEGAADV